VPPLNSVTIHAPEGVARPSNLPSIRSFEVTPVHAGSAQGSYRISWDVEGAEPSQVWLSAVNCLDDLNIQRLPGNGANGSSFPCGVLEPAESAKGSLILKFSNMSGQEVKETVGLFADGRESVSLTRTISLPPLPVIITVGTLDTAAKTYIIDSSHPPRYTQIPTYQPHSVFPKRARRPVQLVAGQSVKLDGVAFLPVNTLWIGSRSITVSSPDGQRINFTVPRTIPDGLYILSLANEHGRSNPVKVQITSSPASE
jgi:hypothetical protein